MAKELITGAAGFIGSHLCDLFDDPDRCDVRNAGMLQPAQIIDYVNDHRPKAVFHLGAISSTTETNTALISENNILLSCRLLERCIEMSIPFVYASSAAVYGLGNRGFCEDANTSPINYYAISKAYFDAIVMQKIIDNPQSQVVGLRYFNVYGDGEDHKADMASPVHKFLQQSRESDEIRIFEGSKNYLRDFIHVDDVMRITKAAASFPSGIYNVGTGIPRSFLDVATIISAITGSKIIEVPFPSYLIGKYQEFTCSNNDKINTTKCSSDRISLEEGVQRVVNA
jgi:ADP-L-glycero-D-manno-heptose 6-epimerase